MVRDAESTRQRIFDAAAEEFARRGIAGARIDRIAANACANKQLIYAYFGSKQLLFEAVITDQVTRFFREVRFDPRALPEFAAQTYDFFVAHPELARLGAWHSLEEDSPPIALIATSVRRLTRQLARAQAEGYVDATIKARELFQLTIAIAQTWANPTPELRGVATAASVAARRSAVTETVRRLTAATP
jgi:AcrR family transcriptional regulator